MPNLYGALVTPEDDWEFKDDQEMDNEENWEVHDDGEFGIAQLSTMKFSSGDPKVTRRNLLLAIFVTMVIAVSTLVLLTGQKFNSISGRDNYSTSAYDASNAIINVVSVSNEYGELDLSAMLPYEFLTDSFLIEPYKETTITIGGLYNNCNYNWSFIKFGVNSVNASDIISTDQKLNVTLISPGAYNFTILEKCGEAMNSHRQLNMKVWVKYIRRELSMLNDFDREEFLDAFHVLWNVSTTQGKVLYGDRYKSVKYFATLHNDGGGNAACDEFHGGLGFLNNHMYLSAYLEQSLQLVNPKVALNYLDYSKYFESAAYANHLENQLDGGSWTEILTAKFFGATDPISGRILDGRWKLEKVPTVTLEFLIEEGIDPDHTFFPEEEDIWLDSTDAHLSSPYGLLRSPWNYNPSPYVTRFGSVYGINKTSIMGPERNKVFRYHMGVTCEYYGDFFNEVKNKPLETYLKKMEDDTHGIFHFTFGGIGGQRANDIAQSLINDYNFSNLNIGALSISSQPFFKKNLAVSHSQPLKCTANPWINGVLSTNISAGEIGGPSCDFADKYYVNETTINGLIEFFFAIDPSTVDSVVTHIENLTVSDRMKVMKIIANLFPFDGDLAGSGAAMDPLFWVAHGAMEKTFQKSVFEGLFSDMKFNSVDHCSGHSAAFPKLWLKGFYFADEDIAVETLNNDELTVILDPTSEDYPNLINFVYDTASFDWCDNSDAWFS